MGRYRLPAGPGSERKLEQTALDLDDLEE